MRYSLFLASIWLAVNGLAAEVNDTEAMKKNIGVIMNACGKTETYACETKCLKGGLNRLVGNGSFSLIAYSACTSTGTYPNEGKCFRSFVEQTNDANLVAIAKQCAATKDWVSESNCFRKGIESSPAFYQ